MPEPHEAAMGTGSAERAEPEDRPRRRGGRGGRKRRKHEGKNPLSVECPDCGREEGRHCLNTALLTNQFHPGRILVANGAKHLRAKRDGDTKRVIRRLNRKKVRLSVPD
jgi:hypothetical protein